MAFDPPERRPESIPAELIRTAMTLYRRGVPIRKIAEFFAADRDQVERELRARLGAI